MKPNFALSLSVEGIRLLHRAAGGWREVGEVSLNAADMAGELAVLRKTASGLEPGGVRCKLIIPNEQIKYLTVPTPNQSDASRRVEVKMALNQATPYQLDELAFDLSADGDNTHVAAVAKDTLAEAEAFATEHRFHPVSFVAIPGDQRYIGEPHFGETSEAAELLESGETVEPDGVAVVVLGPVLAAPAALTKAVVPQSEEAVEDEPGESETREAKPNDEAAVLENSADVPSDDKLEPASDQDAKATVAGATDADATIDLDRSKPDANSDTVETEEPDTEGSDKSDAAVVAADAADETKDNPKSDDTETEQAAEKSETANAAPSDANKAALASKAANVDAKVPTKTGTDVLANSTDTKEVSAKPAEAPLADAPTEPVGDTDTPHATVPLTMTATGSFVSRRNQAADTAVAARSEPPMRGVNIGAIGGGKAVVPDSTSLNKPMPVAAPPIAKPGFLSRRRTAVPAPIVGPAPTAVESAPRPAVAPSKIAVPTGEADRLTVFGARAAQVGGKPRFLAIILTVVLLVFLAGVAAWATVFLDNGIAGLFRGDKNRATASAPEFQIEPRVIRAPIEQPVGLETASLNTGLTPEDEGVLEALRDPAPVQEQISPQEAAARYAVTGIWPYAPDVPSQNLPNIVTFDDVYLTSIDPLSVANDAIALPSVDGYQTDQGLSGMASPAAAGTNFALDARGLIIPQADGALSPDGFTVFLGKPPAVPPAVLARLDDTPVVDTTLEALARARPKDRPDGLAEKTERAQLDGLTRRELAGLRPQLRPKSVQQSAEAAAKAAAAEALAAEAKPEEEEAKPDDPLSSATKLAAVQSPRPDARPKNFNRIVSRAQKAPRENTDTVRTASAGTIAPRTVTPKIPSKASVARSATVRNAINLKRVNLIGVYGKPSSRRALVRLANGRYKKVTVGDRIDGGRVSAISNSELKYRKGSRSVVLKMPKG